MKVKQALDECKAKETADKLSTNVKKLYLDARRKKFAEKSRMMRFTKFFNQLDYVIMKSKKDAIES